MVTDLKDDTTMTIVSLHDWKEKHPTLIQQRRLEAEYASLPFPELVQKAQELLATINGSDYSLDLARQSMTLLQEIRKRIERDSPLLSMDVARMLEEISSRQDTLA